jgi:hypothetical protein
MFRPHVTAPAAPGQGLGAADGIAGLSGLRQRQLRGLARTGKQLARRGARSIGPHAQLLQDRRRHTLLEQGKPGRQPPGCA